MTLIDPKDYHMADQACSQCGKKTKGLWMPRRLCNGCDRKRQNAPRSSVIK
jgi:hypothetical protein